MIADHYMITDFGCFKAGEAIPEVEAAVIEDTIPEENTEVAENIDTGAAEVAPVDAPKTKRRRKKDE